MKTSQSEVSKHVLYQTACNKRPMLPVPTVHCTLLFCIELCSVELVDLVVLQSHSLEPELDYDAN